MQCLATVECMLKLQVMWIVLRSVNRLTAMMWGRFAQLVICHVQPSNHLWQLCLTYPSQAILPWQLCVEWTGEMPYELFSRVPTGLLRGALQAMCTCLERTVVFGHMTKKQNQHTSLFIMVDRKTKIKGRPICDILSFHDGCSSTFAGRFGGSALVYRKLEVENLLRSSKLGECNMTQHHWTGGFWIMAVIHSAR